MTRGLGLGANVRLLRVACTVPGSSFHEVTRANWEYGSQSDVLLVRLSCSTGSSSRRNHRKLGSRPLPLTAALFTLPGMQLHWARAQAQALFHGFFITSPPPERGVRRSVTSFSAGQKQASRSF